MSLSYELHEAAEAGDAIAIAHCIQRGLGDINGPDESLGGRSVTLPSRLRMRTAAGNERGQCKERKKQTATTVFLFRQLLAQPLHCFRTERRCI